MIKRIEWPRSHPDRLRVIYVGGREHTHPPPQPQNQEEEGSTSVANQYNLANQMFGPSHDSS